MQQDQIEEIEIELLIEAIFRRYGYDFSGYARASFVRRVRQFMVKARETDITVVIKKLLYDSEFFQDLVQAFSVTVTEMFRDPLFYKALRETVVPYLKTFPTVKVWTAGCATGQEVYSLAILLDEEGLLEKTQIIATDFNDAALDRAKEGIFSLDNIKAYIETFPDLDR